MGILLGVSIMGIIQCQGITQCNGYPLGFRVSVCVRLSDILLARFVRCLIGRKGGREVSSLSLRDTRPQIKRWVLTHSHTQLGLVLEIFKECSQKKLINKKRRKENAPRGLHSVRRARAPTSIKKLDNNGGIKNRLDNYLIPPLKMSFDAHRSQTLHVMSPLGCWTPPPPPPLKVNLNGMPFSNVITWNVIFRGCTLMVLV
jgi:hypothetical protein